MAQPNSSISTDALPMAPRQPDEQEAPSAEQLPQSTYDNEAPESTATEDFEEIPEPHPDWQFNLFLDQIADGITEEEFDKLKHLYRGQGGINETALKEMKSVRDLFGIMRTRRLLSRENLIYLQSMLYRLGRVDLIKEGVEYAKAVGNVMHFYTATTLPENGFKYVKFHVEGRNFRSCSRGYVQNLRSRVASVLFIPSDFVIIAGIEPSSSLLITLMIPEEYVPILKSILEDQAFTAEMEEFGIDFVEIDKVYKVGGAIGVEMVSDNDQQKKFTSLYQQLEMKSRDLDESEIERIRLSQQLTENKERVVALEEQHSKDEIMIMALKASNKDSLDDKESNESSSQRAIQEFESALKTVNQQDKSVIHTLISANTWVVANRLTERFSIQQRKMELALEELQSQILPLQFELQKIRFFSEIDPDEMDRTLLEFYEMLIKSIVKEVSTITVVLDEDFLHILKKLSRSLRAREREKLVMKYTWNKDEKLKQAIDRDPFSVLSCILLKEIEETKTLVDMEQFITKCLIEVNRSDLVKKFKDLLRGKTQSENNQKRKRRQRSGSLPRTTNSETKGMQEEQMQILNKISEQVQQILDNVQRNRKYSAQNNGFPNEPDYVFGPPPYSKYPCW